MNFLFEIRYIFPSVGSWAIWFDIWSLSLKHQPIEHHKNNSNFPNANFQCVQTSFHPAQLFLGDDVTANFEMVFFHCGDSNFHVFVTINTLYCILQHSWITLSMLLRKPSQRASGLVTCELLTAVVKTVAIFVNVLTVAAVVHTTDRHLAWQVRESTGTLWCFCDCCCTTTTRPKYDFSWFFHTDLHFMQQLTLISFVCLLIDQPY